MARIAWLPPCASRPLRTVEGHTDGVNSVTLSGDGRQAVSAAEDRTLKVWDLETGAIASAFTSDATARCFAFAADRRIVAGDASGRVHFLSLEL